MADPTAEHGTPAGFRMHLKTGAAVCNPCQAARTAAGILSGAVTVLAIQLPVLLELLNGGNAVEVLTRERGAVVVAAIRQSGGAA